MNANWIGKRISLDCGALGIYQGVIKKLDIENEKTITIEKVFKDGRPSDIPEVTFRACDIEDVSFVEIEKATARDPEEKSVVEVTKKNTKKTDHESGQDSASSSGKLKVADRIRDGTKKNKNRNSPAFQQHHRLSPRKNMERNTPISRKDRFRAKDEDCFGTDVAETDMTQEFDFESNLALFNKKLVFEEIDDEMNQKTNQPDIVRLVDCNLRRAATNCPSPVVPKSEPKYRNDENVLVGVPAQYRPIETGEEPPPGEYVTDSGLIVPAVSYELRYKFEQLLRSVGISEERIADLIARAGVELAVQQFGGSHRLNPENSHQVPQAVILCGPSRTGYYGLTMARHLAAQGVATTVYLPDLPSYPKYLEKELSLYILSDQKHTHKSKNLPKSRVDLIICSLEDHEMWQQERSQPWFIDAIQWAKQHQALAQVLTIDPPSTPLEPALASKSCLVPCLPLWLSGDSSQASAGKVYMVNLSVPKKVYSKLGIKFNSPFGAKTCIPLHRVT